MRGLASLMAQVIPGYTDKPGLMVLYNLLSGINAAFMMYLTAWAGYRAAEIFGGTPILAEWSACSRLSDRWMRSPGGSGCTMKHSR